MTTKLNTACPACGHLLRIDSASIDNGDPNRIDIVPVAADQMDEGSLTICGRCLMVLAVEDGALRLGTYIDAMLIPQKIRELHELLTGRPVRWAGNSIQHEGAQ